MANRPPISKKGLPAAGTAERSRRNRAGEAQLPPSLEASERWPASAPPAEGFLQDFFYDPQEDGGALPVLVSDVAAVEIPAPAQDLQELLSFRLAAEDYAIEIGDVYEIIRVAAITEVPRAPPAILGVISLRGEALPVFDLGRLLGTRPSRAEVAPAPGARVVILQTEKGLAGILVDAVDQVVRLPQASIEPPPRGLSARPGGAVLKGIGRWQGRLLAILDPVELLQPERRR